MTENAHDILRRNVEDAKRALADAERALLEFERAPERNVFDSLDDAYDLEDELLERAAADCEGSHNVGHDEYRQGFYVGDTQYVAILTVEYNRHDRRYYYIDGHAFRIEDA